MKPKSYKQCRRCVMDTSDLEIIFDDDGFCNHCTEFLIRQASVKGRQSQVGQQFEEACHEIKAAGKYGKYDCIIGLSGGADSSYLAYKIKRGGLRALAVHMDNGWDSEKSVTNIRKITSALELDYESYVLDWEEFRDLQLAFLKASVPEAETPTDIAIPAALHHFAAKYDVKYIVSAGNLATEGILPKSWHYNARDLKYFNYIKKTFGKGKLKSFPTFGYKKEIYYKLVKGIKTVYPLDFLPFNKQMAIQALKAKFDWKDYGGKHYESRYTKFIQSFYLYEKFGIDYRRASLASQICTGQTTRDEALRQLKIKPYDESEVTEEKQYIAKKLAISTDELENLLRLPPKWYWDYPTDGRKLEIIYNAYRKLYKKEKIGNF